MKNTEKTNFKVVGYYPNWEPDKVDMIQYDKITNIIYAFGIPKTDGTLRPLENPGTAKKIIHVAKKHGVRVSLAIGGWSYKDIPLEQTFIAATDTPDKVKKLGDSIIATAKEYGFDGIDMDWEHPRTDGDSKYQYEALMLYLSKNLKKENMLLTSAVIAGINPNGTPLHDSQGHSDAVLEAVDWINLMAYDGGEGSEHSSYEFAISSANYWKNDRGMPSKKVVLGLPFYGRPTWKPYDCLLEINPEAHMADITTIDNVAIHYNGLLTMENKTKWACENVGGVMIWELSQDVTDPNKSLLNAIDKVVKKRKLT